MCVCVSKMAGCSCRCRCCRHLFPHALSYKETMTHISFPFLQSPCHHHHPHLLLLVTNNASSVLGSACVQSLEGKRWLQGALEDRARAMVVGRDFMGLENASHSNLTWCASLEQDCWDKGAVMKPEPMKPQSKVFTPLSEPTVRVIDPALTFVLRTDSSEGLTVVGASGDEDELWLTIRKEARRDAVAEPVLASYFNSTILAHRSIDRALAFHLGNKLASDTLLSTHLMSLILDTFMEDAEIRDAIRADLIAVKQRDPACLSYLQCILNFKGFLGCQAHRVAHRLWQQGRNCLALALQSRVSEEFHMDIHPAAKIGKGVLFDHATGVVVGETAVIGNNVSILHNVTLGGTGALGGDRHPKLGDGVLVGAGSILLGPITVGEGAKIGAGSVVLINVPAHTTAVGNPARLLGGKNSPQKLEEIPSKTMDHTSFMESWSDYVI